MFIGRQEEIKKLENFIKDSNSVAALIYGRRRIGKTELIKQAIMNPDIISVYYECKETSEENNAENITESVAQVLGIPVPGYDSIEGILKFIFNSIKNYCSGKTFVLVLDEYSYLKNAVRGLDSILQGLIDECKENPGVKVILCGSFIATMQSLIEKQSPLYGRIDLTVKLQEMDYYDSAQFYGEFDNEDKVKLFSVFGGVPYYNRLIDSNKSVIENIIDIIASDGARLENEISLNLKSELSKVTSANEVFETLAKGYVRFSDILSQSHVSSSPALADILDKLCKMELVEKISPINDKSNKKKTGYYIKDRLSLFYYKYIFRNVSALKIMTPAVFVERFILPDYEASFVPRGFEIICKEFLIRKNKSGELDEIFDEIGSYYYDDPKTKTNGQFDIVTHDPNGYISYEVKFHKEALDDKIVDEEIRQVINSGLKCYKYGFFSRTGYAENVRATEDIILYDLTDMY